MKRLTGTTRQRVTGLLLLLSMLFYVSGAALGLHLCLDHAHHAVETSAHHTADSHCNHEPAQDKETAPDKPTEHKCEFCDMLAGINKPTAVFVDPHIVITPSEAQTITVPGCVITNRIIEADLSRRGPPPSC